VACAERVAPRRVCVEFRNRTWMTPENQEETLGFLASHSLPYVCVDMPQGYPSSIPPVLAVTSDLAVMRLHGHSDKWDSKDIYERFGYKYSDAELSEWAPKIRDLASGAAVTHVLFNNCYRNYAQVNATYLEERLEASGLRAGFWRPVFAAGLRVRFLADGFRGRFLADGFRGRFLAAGFRGRFTGRSGGRAGAGSRCGPAPQSGASRRGRRRPRRASWGSRAW
jgi:hypothetical protein